MVYFAEKKWKLKEMVRLENLYITLSKRNVLWENDKTKEKGFGLLEAVNTGKVNI